MIGSRSKYSLGALLLILATTTLGGCSIGYYWHLGKGQLAIQSKSKPVERLIDAPATPEELRAQLLLAQQILDFASSELALDPGSSYRRYVDLNRDAASWILVAVPTLSIEPHEWCYPLLGCLLYRGYFSYDRAVREAARFEGFDTRISPVRAYSTLGWFADPLTNVILDLEQDFLASLLFHELAHREVFIAGDDELNESFATVVATEGLERWRGDTPSAKHPVEREALIAQVQALKLAAREELGEIYAGDLAPDDQLAAKTRTLQALEAAIRKLETNSIDIDRWIPADGFNNADLALSNVYLGLVPELERLLTCLGADLSRFYAFVEQLAEREASERRAIIDAGCSVISIE